MERDPWPSTYDRDLDVPTHAPRGPIEPIDRYPRLVVNPLVAVLSVVGAILILRSSLHSRNLTAFLTAIGLLSVSLLFTQFHCLDCGATSWLSSAGRHACPPLLARWRGGRPVRWPFPSARVQLIVWLYVIASVATLLLILFASRR